MEWLPDVSRVLHAFLSSFEVQGGQAAVRVPPTRRLSRSRASAFRTLARRSLEARGRCASEELFDVTCEKDNVRSLLSVKSVSLMGSLAELRQRRQIVRALS